MKSKLIIAVISFLCGAAAVMLLHHRSAIAPPAVSSHGVLPSEMDRRIARVEFHQTPLQTALDTLSRESGCPIVVRWPELVVAGINEYTPVDADLHDVPLSAALKVVLSEATANFGYLEFRADGETVLISTRSDLLADEMVLRVYDASSVAHDVMAHRQMRATTNPSKPSLTVDVEDEIVNAEVAYVLEREVFKPAIWGEQMPHDPEFYSCWNGRLIVFNTPAVQSRIEDALRTWRTASRDHTDIPD